MPDSLSITAATVDPGLLDLPWDQPLEDWPDDVIVALRRASRGTSCASCT